MSAHGLLNALWSATWSGSLAILLVLLARHPLRRAFGAGVAYAVWLLVPACWLALLAPARTVLVSGAGVAMAPVSHGAFVEPIAITAGDAAPWWSALWLVGALAMAAWQGWQQHRFMRGLGTLRAVAGEARVVQAQSRAGLPALVGLLHPRIVLPADCEVCYDAAQRALLLAHEHVHLHRGDAWVNALVAASRALLWFNPFVHVAARCLRHDQELACDARVLEVFPHARRSYASAVLNTATLSAAAPASCHWGNAHPLKERIMLISRTQPSHRMRRYGMRLVGLTACVLAIGVWAAQPPQPQTDTSAGGAGKADYTAQIELALDGGTPAHFSVNPRFGVPVVLHTDQPATPATLSANVQPVRVRGELGYAIGLRVERDGKLVNTPRVVVLDGHDAEVVIDPHVIRADPAFDAARPQARGAINIKITVTARDRQAALAQAEPFVVPAPLSPPAPPAPMALPVPPVPPPASLVPPTTPASPPVPPPDSAIAPGLARGIMTVTAVTLPRCVGISRSSTAC